MKSNKIIDLDIVDSFKLRTECSYLTMSNDFAKVLFNTPSVLYPVGRLMVLGHLQCCERDNQLTWVLVW